MLLYIVCLVEEADKIPYFLFIVEGFVNGTQAILRSRGASAERPLLSLGRVRRGSWL